MRKFKYNGIELEVPSEAPQFSHSVPLMLASLGRVESNDNIPYFEKVIQFKEYNLPEGEILHDVCALLTLQKMNYQIQNGGFEQYYDNGYHEYRAGYDIGDLALLDIGQQIMFLGKMIGFVQTDDAKKDVIDDMVAALILFSVMPDRIYDYERLDDEDKECATIEGADEFDKAWYKITDTIEWAIEMYAQYICKRLEGESDGSPINKAEYYRMRYPTGTKLRLKADIQDPFTPIIAGDVLTVDYIDDAGQIHGVWKSGSHLALIIGKDDFEIC